MRYAYPAILSPEDDGRYSIWFPDLRGCATSGVTIADAMENARDALGLWLDSTQRHNNPIPQASMIGSILLEPTQTITWVDIDLDAYRLSLGEKSVKKTLSIPLWMDTAATEAGINFSQALQDVLTERLNIHK